METCNVIAISYYFFSGSGSTDGAEGGNSEKLSPSKLSELTSPSPGPSNNSYSLLQNDNVSTA